MSGGSDLGEQIGGAIEPLEQLDQGQRRLGLAVLVAREGIDATAKKFSGLPLVEIELPAYLGDVARIDVSGIHLALERAHPFAVAIAMLTIEDNFTASRAKVARHCRDSGGFALVGVAHVARVVDQCRRAAAWAFHGHSSLKETIDTSSMTVGFRYTSAPLAVLVSRHGSSVGLRWPSKRIAALHRLPIRSVLAARCALRCAPMAARSLRHLIG